MSALTEFRRQVEAARSGDHITLKLLRSESQAVEDLAFNFEVPLLDRMLAAAASGNMRKPVVEAALSEEPELRQAVIDLANSQAGDVTIGAAAGRDVVTINVYVGTDHN